MSARAAPLRQRLMWAFALFTLGVAGLFGLYALVFTYAVEDSFLEATLAKEAAVLQHDRAKDGAWGEPRENYMRVYASAADFPADLREAHREEPWRREFGGSEGRHYHVIPLAGEKEAPQAWLVAEVSSQLVVRPMRGTMIWLMAATTLVLLVLALAVAAWLARRTAGPLATLATAVEGMDPANLPLGLGQGFRNDEVGVLARGLDALAGRLREFVDREREFTRDVSHELRTPLTVIRSASERLLAREDLDGDVRATAMHLQQSALQLQQTVDLLLSLAREQAPEPGSAPVRVLPVLERVVVDQAPLAEGRALELDIDVPTDATTDLPEAVLRSLLSNLVGNAMAHGAEGRVHIGVQGGDLLVQNAVSPDQPARPGLGLGLGIVSRLCERHGITLQLETTPHRVTARIRNGVRSS